jgi:glutamyl/glutaminyl-tRNA synthetase
MLSNELIERLIAQLAPDGHTPRVESEATFPKRMLPEGAEVMRVPPSPTGFVHLGTVYAGLINERIAHQTGGVFILRIEDTDKKREVEGSVNRIVQAFRDFDLKYDEGPGADGSYGPYFQSERARIYLGYAIELLKSDRAYPCFATPEELSAAVQDQQAKKFRPGYYGMWAIWRDKSEDEVTAALDAGKPFVLRFRSMGSHDQRIKYTDVFKGEMEVPENDLDVPLIKSDEHRLPTYHLAHIVDDHLMHTTKVFRSDEWLPSTALHIELSQAFGLKPFTYGHFAPISIIDKNGGGKRKLSKRKDPEADVKFWLEAGYPIEGVKAYLLGLANSTFEEWYRANPGVPLTNFPVSLEKLAASRAPLLDMAKLEDYSKDYIASLPQSEFNAHVITAAVSRPQFKAAMESDIVYTHNVLSVERDGPKPRKDLSAWGQAYEHYAYFYDELFEADFAQQGAREFLADFDDALIVAVCQSFLLTYDPADDQQTWFDKLKIAAESIGFTTDNKAFKADPTQFKGNIADFARILRVKLTGRNRTPDLWTIMQVMGTERVKRRLS